MEALGFIKQLLMAVAITALLAACSPAPEEAKEKATEEIPEEATNDKQSQTTDVSTYSSFGVYQELPAWSDWCPRSKDSDACEKALQSAVEKQSKTSRPTVRAHGWKLWAGIISPLNNTGYDLATNTSTYSGTTGCTLTNSKDEAACSGVYPIWYSWPNTGVPFSTGTASDAMVKTTELARPNLLNINRRLADSGSHSSTLGATQTTDDYTHPTKTQTVNTPAPVYQLPPLTLVKQCGLPADKVDVLFEIAYNDKSTTTQQSAAWNELNKMCIAKGFPNVLCVNTTPSLTGICDGATFINQGDVMIATESLSTQAWDAVQDNELYNVGNKLSELYDEGNADVAANTVAKWFKHEFVATKHMYWPVKGCVSTAKIGEAGCRIRYGALPPWVPADFKQYSYATNNDYLGYENWNTVVAIDTCADCASSSGSDTSSSATLVLEDVYKTDGTTAISPIITENPDVYPTSTFVHVQMSQEVLDKLSATDKALLDQATIWAYGSESNGFEAGDFLVVAAMHVTTKEIDTWAFQSVWWSPMNDTAEDCSLTLYNNCFGQSDIYNAANKDSSGLSSADLAALDAKVGSVWQDNYLMTESYGINYEIDGTKTEVKNYFTGLPKIPNWASKTAAGDDLAVLPVSMNVYIEPVIHPIGTNCQNCHRRAGFSGSPPNAGEYAAGVGRTGGQTSQCPSLLGDYGDPAVDACLTTPWAWNQNITPWGDGKAVNTCTKNNDGTTTKCKGAEAFPIVNSDLSWFVADKHVQKGTK